MGKEQKDGSSSPEGEVRYTTSGLPIKDIYTPEQAAAYVQKGIESWYKPGK